MNPFVREDIVGAVMASLRAAGPLPAECEGLPEVEQSARARAIRRIKEIVNARGWGIAVTRTLDKHQASYVSDLPDDAVFSLHEYIEQMEDVAQCGHEYPDAPPAT